MAEGLSVGTGQLHFLPGDDSNEIPVCDRDELLSRRCPSCGLILVDQESAVPENEAARDVKKSRSCMFRVGWGLLALCLLLISPKLFFYGVGVVVQPFICIGVLALIGIPTYLVTRGLSKESEPDSDE